jgi:isopenicillin-N epimerase
MTFGSTTEKSAYGATIRHLWGLSADGLIVNHGSYGATPLDVLREQDRWRGMMEGQPTFFMQRILPDAIRRAATRLADFMSADPDRLVFVENATSGINAILRSFPFERGDEILVLSHGYGAVRKTADYVAQSNGARTVEVDVPFPHPDENLLLARLDAAIGPRARLAILDHVTSPSALTLPVAAMVRICRDRSVPVIVDGAHAPGQLSLDIAQIDADWYVGNCHKWLMAPKGAAFLSAGPRAREIHPTTISHGFGTGLAGEFDWVGTRDWSACLSVPAAIDFRARLGHDALMARDRDLAWDAASYLAGRFGTDLGADRHWHGAMALIRLPAVRGILADDAVRLREALLDRRCDAAISFIDGAIWLRLSVAPYNEPGDYVRLADMLEALLVR